VSRSRLAAVVWVILAIAGAFSRGAAAAAPLPDGAGRAIPGADAPPSASGASSSARSPSGPPLTTGETGVEPAEADSSTTAGELDPLVGNGLSSPFCRGTLGAAGLSPTSAGNCETSGFIAAPAPTGNYGLDVHIDTGVLGLSEGGLLSVVQDVVIAPLWMGLVWGVHALVVMLEWAFAIDLFNSSSASGLGSELRQMQASFTAPWLALVLAVGAVLSAYNGLVRRRVAETLGQVLMTLVMMAAGLWTIADPRGTVGAIAGWANQASLGTLAVASRGAPGAPASALSDGMSDIFATTVEGPWCYMEFGDVSWCRDRSRLDPRLQKAALAIAGTELALVGCRPDALHLLPCALRGSAQATALQNSARLLREAQTNAGLFLALPANGWARNSINDRGSLLRVLCGAPEATNCRGPTAAQAQFRTNGGTWPRLGGLILIAAGAIGMMLLLGYIALRLFVAAILSLLLLLLAPAMALAPALGDSGRELFRRWAGQLLGAVASKLVFAFLLGIVLAVGAVLTRLHALGWWTQWLLSSTFWWTAFIRRNLALGVAYGALGRERLPQSSLVQRTRRALDAPRLALGAGKRARARFRRPAPDRQSRSAAAVVRRERAETELRRQTRRTFEHDSREAGALLGRAPDAQREVAMQRAQLSRVRQQTTVARERGERRRELRLEHRAGRIENAIAQQQTELAAARSIRRVGRDDTYTAVGRRLSGQTRTGAEFQRREAFLAAQAALPRGVLSAREPTSGRRDYAALAGLVGRGPREYRRLDAGSQRKVRLEIDRELAVRQQLTAMTGDLVEGPRNVRVSARQRRSGDQHFERKMRDLGAQRPDPTAIGRWRAEGRRLAATAGEQPSVMADARAVAARRKRQLGFDRP